MVALIFHELAHQVLYVSGDTTFNESFATAVELEGLKLWSRQNDNPEVFERARERLQQREQTLNLVRATSQQLEALYQQQGQIPVAALRQRKDELLTELVQTYLRLSEQWQQPGPFGANPTSLNNANLALFRQYNQYVPGFRQLLLELNHDFPAFYRAVEDLSERPRRERQQTLEALSERFNEDF